MNKLFIMLIFISTGVFAQSQQGYYVKNDGQIVNGYFKNSEFKNPETLQFSQDTDGKFSKVNLEDIIEYGIGKEYRLRKANVMIDRSNMNSQRANHLKDPQWVKKTVFLNILVQGKATLYSYSSDWGTKYFFGFDDDKVQQLIYKPYSPQGTIVIYNTGYKTQLYNELSCNGQTINDFESVKYNEKSLGNIIKNYNSCNNSESITYSNSTSAKPSYKGRVYAGIQSGSYKLSNPPVEVTSSGTTDFIGGVEFAFVAPSKKYEVFARAEYEPISGNASGNIVRSVNTTNITYSADGYSINVLIGPRYNFLRMGKHLLSGDIGVGISSANVELKEESTIIPHTGSPSYPGGAYTYDTKSTFIAEFGLGYTFNEKFGVVAHYTLPRNFFTMKKSGTTLESDWYRVSLNLVYTVF